MVLEEKLAKISGVLEISIVGKPDKNAGNVTVAYVVTDNRKIFETVKRELIAYCDNNLEKYERPVDFIYVSELPRTMIGKIDYRELEELAIQ